MNKKVILCFLLLAFFVGSTISFGVLNTKLGSGVKVVEKGINEEENLDPELDEDVGINEPVILPELNSCINTTGFEETKSFVVKNVTYYPSIVGNSCNSVTAAGRVGTSNTTLVIPDFVEYNNITYHVLEINNNAFQQGNIESLTLGNNLSKINSNSFANNNIKSVIIPNSVVTIGDNAFYNNLISSLVIPDSVNTIGYASFLGNEIESLTLGNGLMVIGPEAFYNLKYGSFIIPSNVKDIGKNAFGDCNIFIPDGFGHKQCDN